MLTPIRPPFEVQVFRHLLRWAETARASGVPRDAVIHGAEELWLAIYASWARDCGPRPKGAVS